MSGQRFPGLVTDTKVYLTIAHLRIIAGEFRGRKLMAPLDQQTRPITDRVKQSLFDILAPLIPGAFVYDCFAGTGSMGLEALSRGASHAIFFENARTAVQLLQHNIADLGLSQRSHVVSGDLFKWFQTDLAGAGHRAEIIFLDPPYRFLLEKADQLQKLARQIGQGHLAASGIVVFRHDEEDSLELPSLVRYDLREYGGMTIEFLRKPND